MTISYGAIKSILEWKTTRGNTVFLLNVMTFVYAKNMEVVANKNSRSSTQQGRLIIFDSCRIIIAIIFLKFDTCQNVLDNYRQRNQLDRSTVIGKHVFTLFYGKTIF